MIIFISDLINDYQQWYGGDRVFIQTSPGSGKTSFILEKLSKYAMREGTEVLLLVNRKILKLQIKQVLAREHGIESMTDEEIEGIDNFAGITVKSYQEIQEKIKKDSPLLVDLSMKRYRYIVLDECHYFLQDSLFNRNIQYLLFGLLHWRNSVLVFMSATMDEVKPFLMGKLGLGRQPFKTLYSVEGRSSAAYLDGFQFQHRIFNYEIKADFRIQSIRYFEELEELTKRINADDTIEKWLVFVNSKKEAERIKKGLTCNFAYLDAEIMNENPVIEKIVKEEKYEEKVLITTQVLDNGINLVDRNLKNIVLLTTEKTEFIQMLGRKRFKDKDEKINLFICARSAAFFNYLRNKKISPMMNYIQEIHADDTFRQSHFDNKEFWEFCQGTTIIEGGKMIISEAAEEKLSLVKTFCDQMIVRLKNNPQAFIIEQLSWIGKSENFSPHHYLEFQTGQENRRNLRLYLKEFEGKKLDKESQNVFREEICQWALKLGKKLTDRGSRLAGKSKINEFLEREGLSFYINSVNNSRYWQIEEVNSNEEELLCH